MVRGRGALSCITIDIRGGGGRGTDLEVGAVGD
jgi:hypothetical protein